MDWLQGIKDLPEGYSVLEYNGKRYGVSRKDFNDGKSIKVYAEELGGTQFISFNFYSTTHSNLLKPCEMPEKEVINFLKNYKMISK